MSATEAAKKASYSEKYADRQAHLLLKNSWVSDHLDSLRDAGTSDAVAD